jgi:hypothetical protein
MRRHSGCRFYWSGMVYMHCIYMRNTASQSRLVCCSAHGEIIIRDPTICDRTGVNRQAGARTITIASTRPVILTHTMRPLAPDLYESRQQARIRRVATERDIWERQVNKNHLQYCPESVNVVRGCPHHCYAIKMLANAMQCHVMSRIKQSEKTPRSI